MPSPIASIDLAALKSNFKTAQKLSPDSQNFAVVKANAYGHGSVHCAIALDQADGFAVATVEEAVELRQASIDKPILVLSRFSHPEEVQLIQQYKLLPVVHSLYQLDLLSNNQRGNQPINCWVKMDSGMNRLGMDARQSLTVLQRISNAPLINAVGLMTHLACADETDNEFTIEQLKLFEQIASKTKLPQSIANSAAIVAWPQAHRDWNRPGLMLYGASPLNGVKPDTLNLLPVMNLTAELISVNNVKKGQGIGYGQTFIADKSIKVGIVPCGYADGYPRHATTGTPVQVCGQPSRLLGRVSMDTLAVDITAIEDAQVGSPVLLWGSTLSVNTIAAHSGSIAYELLTSVSDRVPRLYTG